MDEETIVFASIVFASKSYMRHLVAQTNEYPFLYKYCNFEGGYSMLSAMNIQFTRADELNDEDEINLSITSVYFGRDMSKPQRIKIGQILNRPVG